MQWIITCCFVVFAACSGVSPSEPGEAGQPGPAGPPGVAGSPGAPGAAGAPGQSVVVEAVAPGDLTCPDGGSKLTAANGAVYDCHGDLVLNGGAAPLSSCADIIDAGASRGSGVYRIDPDGGGTRAAVLVYCEMTTLSGGWTLVMNIHPSDGSRVSFTNTRFWLADAEVGDFASRFTNDYKSPAAFTVAGTSVMVQVAHPGTNGRVIGWKAWSMAPKTFDDFFEAPPNTIQTTAAIGSDVTAVHASEAVIKNGTQLISNRSLTGTADRLRLGAGGYAVTNNNQPGLGTQMSEISCGPGVNCWRHHDVELWVDINDEDLWCKPVTTEREFRWVGGDGGCGPRCEAACAVIDAQLPLLWTYRIYVR